MHFIAFKANKSSQYGLNISHNSETMEQLNSVCDLEFSQLMSHIIFDTNMLDSEKHKIKLAASKLVFSVAYISDAFKIEFGKKWINQIVNFLPQIPIVPYFHQFIVSLVLTVRSLVQCKKTTNDSELELTDAVSENQTEFFEQNGLEMLAIFCDNLCNGDANDIAVSTAHSKPLRKDGTINYDYIKILNTIFETFLSFESNDAFSNKLCEMEYNSANSLKLNISNLLVLVWNHCQKLETLETNAASKETLSEIDSIKIATHCLYNIVAKNASFSALFNSQTPENQHKLNQVWLLFVLISFLNFYYV